MGGKLRPVLLRETGKPTIPQVFVGGELVGGATDLFHEYQSGRLAERLAPLGVDLNPMPEDFDPASLLPGWLHKR
jgi:cysteine synthase A